jgi:hypothetical protein
MPIIAILLILGSILTGEKIMKKFTQITSVSKKKIQERMNFTTEEISNSTLTDKYKIDEFWNENIIEFHGYKYRVIDTNGRRMFEPLDKNAPEIVLTSRPEPTLTPIPTLSYKQKTNQLIINTSTSETTTNQPLPTFDSDPIVNCSFPHSGKKQMRKSQCNSAVDCEIAGAWYVYPSKESCNADQNKYNQIYIENLKKQLEKAYSTDTNYSIPTLPPLPDYHFPTSPPHPTYDFFYLKDTFDDIKLPTIPLQRDPYRSTVSLEECRAKAMGERDLLKCEILYGKYKR